MAYMRGGGSKGGCIKAHLQFPHIWVATEQRVALTYMPFHLQRTHRGIYLNFTLGSLIIMYYELGLKPHVCMRNRTTESDRHNDICGLQKIRVYSRKMVFQLHIYPVIILKLYCLWRYSTTIYIAMLFKKTQSHNNFWNWILLY